ncbi:MAG: hypothetical protein HC871_17270 [Rhizobiales bacterium]|nr:hypothetical protein [Hyphomicrobiales bacterium]
MSNRLQQPISATNAAAFCMETPRTACRASTTDGSVHLGRRSAIATW